jgi:CubicO group peptidase (beta-lactamase class C family)
MRILGLGLIWLAAGGLLQPAHGQGCAEFVGTWTTGLPVRDLFEVRVTVREQAGGFVAEIESGQGREVVPVWLDGQHLRFQSVLAALAFDGLVSVDGSSIGGFVQSSSHVTRVSLPRADGAADAAWTMRWSPLGRTGDTARFDLYVQDDRDGRGGFFFFRDQRLPALWGYGLECSAGSVQLGEKNLGLWFTGGIGEAGDLELTATGPTGSMPVVFQRVPQDGVPAQPDASVLPARDSARIEYDGLAPASLEDGWPTAAPSEVGIVPGLIGDLVRAVAEGELAYTHSVLVTRGGRLAVEEYFYGFDRETLHDMRSASKTVTSTLIGLAIQDGRIESSDARALSFFPNYRRYDNWDPRKADITVRHLLTMSSGLDANDSDPASTAAEGTYQSQTRRPDWIKLALDAPMLEDPGTQPLYGSANPMILGGVLAGVVDEPVEWFAHLNLFEPLGIESYRFFLDPTGIPYMGGGLYLRPRDMAKFGQMYLDGGMWQGRRVLDEAWIEESWGRYGRLRPLDRNGHEYGYLWWHHQYEVGDRTIETVEARGNGGQYIFVAPSVDLVVVITSGNFRNGKTREPEEILRRFILPAVVR